MRNPAAWPVFALLVNALVWGVSWWPFRHMQAQGLHPLVATAWMYGACAVVVACARPSAARECLQHRSLWLIALASGTTNAAFNWAVTVGDVVRVVLLFYAMPVWAVLLARVMLQEPIAAQALVRVAVALVGVVMVVGAGHGSGGVATSGPWWIDALALVGGFAFALNNVLLKREADRTPVARTLAMFAGGCGLAALVAVGLRVASPGLSDHGLTPSGWTPWLVALVSSSALAFLIGNVALQYGAARLAAQTTALVMLTEVVFASASAVALDAAVLDARVVLGGALILLAALMAAHQATRA